VSLKTNFNGWDKMLFIRQIRQMFYTPKKASLEADIAIFRFSSLLSAPLI